MTCSPMLVSGEDPDGRTDEMELLYTLALLLVAGHETTVNLISNGTLALLRTPTSLDRLRREPALVVPLVEEVLRYDPPKQFRTRTTLAEIGGRRRDNPQGRDSGATARLRQPRPVPFPRGRTDSCLTARTTSTSPSAAAPTTASARPWPA